MSASIQFDHEKLEVYEFERTILRGGGSTVPIGSWQNNGGYGHGI